MNVKFSPGPWSIDGSVNAGNLDVINGEGRIAMIDDSRSTGWNVPTINANARLIAAAPEMLEALSGILHEVTHDIAGLPRDELLDVVSAVRELAEAAIAKTTGK